MPPTTDEDRLKSPPTELLECVGCGYDLRGLGLDDLCPECALPVVRSQDGDRLEGRDPAWVEALRRGLNWTLVGIFLAILANGLIGGAGTIIYVSIIPQGLWAGVAMILSALMMIPLVCGVWLLTRPDPGREMNEPPMSARRVARGGMIVGALLVPGGALGFSGQQAIALSSAAGAAPPTATVITAIAISLLVAIVTAIAHLAGITWLRSLAELMSGRSFAAQLRWCFRLRLSGEILKSVMLVGLIFILPSLLAQIQASGGSGPKAATIVPVIVAAAIGGIGGLLVFGSTVWVIVILFLFRKPVRLAAEAGVRAET